MAFWDAHHWAKFFYIQLSFEANWRLSWMHIASSNLKSLHWLTFRLACLSQSVALVALFCLRQEVKSAKVLDLSKADFEWIKLPLIHSETSDNHQKPSEKHTRMDSKVGAGGPVSVWVLVSVSVSRSEAKYATHQAFVHATVVSKLPICSSLLDCIRPMSAIQKMLGTGVTAFFTGESPHVNSKCF
jgi:hypothetical protein